MDHRKVSVMVPVFRSVDFIAEALEAVFCQVTDEMEVLIFDDASDDGTMKVIDRVVAKYGRGRILVVRQPTQRRAFNFLDMIKHARGEILVWFHGDDISLPHRLAKVLACFEDEATMVVTSNAYNMDASGRTLGVYARNQQDHEVDNPTAYLDVTCRDTMVGCSLAWRRRLMDEFPLDPNLMVYGEDMVLPFRATLIGKHRYISEPLLRRRLHANNNHVLQGATTRDAGMRENHVSLEQSCLLVRRNDVAWLIEKKGTRPDLEALLREIDIRLIEHMRTWLTLRGKLINDGFKPTWEPLALSSASPTRYWLAMLDRTIDCSGGALVTSILDTTRGWYRPEAWGIWSSGQAVISLRLPLEKPADIHAVLELKCFRAQQRLDISCEGDMLWSGNPGSSFTEVSFTIPAHALRQSEFTLLLSTTPNLRPTDLNPASTDTRHLGVGLRTMLFRLEADKSLHSSH